MVTACALIAAYNEERHVAQVVRGAARHVQTVFVVDDGSTDATAREAEAAGATVIRHPGNLGKGAAIRTGLSRVLDEPFTHVVMLDADLQHDPEEMPHLLEAAAGGADLVLGEREFNKDVMPAPRYYSNVIGARILSWFIGAEVRDSQCGFRVVRCDRLRSLRLMARGYELETEMLIKLARTGASVARVPIRRLQYDGVRSHIRPFRDTFRTCMLALRYRFLS